MTFIINITTDVSTKGAKRVLYRFELAALASLKIKNKPVAPLDAMSIFSRGAESLFVRQ